MKNIEKMSDRELRQELSCARNALSDMADLLNQAKCPNDCDNGVINFGRLRENWKPCQFCAERNRIVAEHG